VQTVSVCLTASISPELHVQSSQIFVHVPYGRVSVLLWRFAIGYVMYFLFCVTSCLPMARIGDSDLTRQHGVLRRCIHMPDYFEESCFFTTLVSQNWADGGSRNC